MTSATPRPPSAPQPIYVVRPPLAGSSIAALVASLVGLVVGFCAFGIPSALAVLLGHVAIHETRGGARRGRGMAIASLVMGYLVAVPWLVVGVVSLAGWIIDRLT